MSQILAMTRKELILWGQKASSWVVVFIVPFLFIWIMQAVFGSSGNPVITIYAVNEDESQESEQVMQALAEADHLEIEILETRSEADRRVGMGERMAAVIIPEGFGTGVSSTYGSKIDLIIDPARSEQANIVVGLVNAALGPVLIDAEVTRGIESSIDQIFGGVIPAEPTATPILDTPTPTVEPSPTIELTVDPTQEITPMPTETPAAKAPTPQLPDTGQQPPDDPLRSFFIAAIKGVVSNQVEEATRDPQVQLVAQPITDLQTARMPSLLDNLVPGYSLMFMFFLVPALATTVIEERQTGTLRRLLTAPVPRSRILFGKMLPFFLIAVVQMTAVLVVSHFIFDIDLGDEPAALGLLILCSALTMSGLGILIAAIARTEGQANGLATIIVLVMAVVSGAMFPNIYIPGLQFATPHYWSMQGFLNIIARGQGLEGVILSAGILLTLATIFFMIGAIRFRFE